MELIIAFMVLAALAAALFTIGQMAKRSSK